MQVRISARDVELPAATRRSIDRRLRLVLGRHATGIPLMQVTLSRRDAAGTLLRCACRVRIRRHRAPDLLVDTLAADPEAAAIDAGRRLQQRLDRAQDQLLSERRWRRSHAALPVVLALLGLAMPATFARAADADAADAALRTRIEARLAELPDGVASAIRVMVRDGRVVLQGRVPLLEHALRAEQAVWKTPGVLDVDNELSVVPAGVERDDALEREVRSIIKGDERFVDTNLEVSVREGRVRLRGVFQDPADVLELKHRIAALSGVLDVQIEAILLARHETRTSGIHREKRG